MSQSRNNERGNNSADEVKGLWHSDPGQIDSGFLSDANIGVQAHFEPEEFKGASRSGENAEDHSTSKKNVNHQMRADSGVVEVGLSKTLSQLTLKPVTINLLKGKVQSEPTVELSPVTDLQLTSDQGQRLQEQREEKLDTEHAQNLWQLYYSQDEDGDTQLHIAIVQGFHEVALSLIRMAPHPSVFDSLNHKRESPLHLAVLTHQSSIARHLVLAGADLSLRNFDGNTALHLAAISGDLASARALTDPLLVTEKTYLAPGRQAPGIPQDLEQRNYEGETCLHSAVVAGNTDIVRLLLGVGADLEAKERLGGRTALHLAIECRRTSVTNLLLKECQPELDALTYGGVTPYEIAICWDSKLAKELIRLGAAPGGNDYMENNEDLNKITSQLWQTVGLRV